MIIYLGMLSVVFYRNLFLEEVTSLRSGDKQQITSIQETEARLVILIGSFARLASLKSSLIVVGEKSTRQLLMRDNFFVFHR